MLLSVDNGPLCVIPGSHLDEQIADAGPVELQAAAGDVLAMRPLLSHASRLSQAATTLHRRVVHIELAASPWLPDGYQWHDFLPITK